MRPLIFAALFLIFISACARPLFSKRASQCFSKDGLDMKTNVIAYGQFAGLAQGQCRLSGGEYFGCQVLWMKNRKDIKPEFDRMPGNDCFRAMVEGNDHYVFFKGLKTFSVAPNEISEDELENARTAARVTAISNLDKFKNDNNPEHYIYYRRDKMMAIYMGPPDRSGWSGCVVM